MPGYDPAPVIAAQEHSLQEYLNLPVREILARLGLQSSANETPAEEPPPEDARPEDEPVSPSAMDPMGLISPVTDALGTLGNGLFNGTDPTAMFRGITQAFQSAGGSVQQSLGAVDDAWQGASGTAAAAKTVTAIANGAEVAAQSDALGASLATAAADVAQARARLIEIITEFQATIAAIGPMIIFPWGWAAAIAAANKAIAATAELMTELQGSLAAEAAVTTAAGAPVDVTAAPELAASPLAGSASQLLSMATQGAMAGIQAATGAASSASAAALQKPIELAESETGEGTGPVPVGAAPFAGAGGSAGGGGIGGGGAGAAFAPRSIATSTMVQPETGAATTQSAAARAAGGGGGMGMMGAPYAPMAGAGLGANGSSSTHTSASFLHTIEQGGEIVGDLGTAAPPVLGEADPTETADLQLRI